METSSDDSNDSPIVRLNSGPLEYETAPKNIEFRLKIRNIDGKWSKNVYMLREGCLLPHTPKLAGIILNQFSQRIDMYSFP